MNYGDQQRQQAGQQQPQIPQSSSHRAQIQQHNQQQQQQYGLSPMNPNPSLIHGQGIGNIQSNMNISVPNTFNRQINQQILQSHFLDPHIQQQSHGIGGTIYSGQTNSGLTSPRIQQQLTSGANQYTGNTQQDQIFNATQQNFFTHSNTTIPQQQQQRYQTIINPMLQQSNISCQQQSLQQTPQVHQINIHSQGIQQQSHQQNIQQHMQQQTYDQQQNIQRQNLQQHQNIQQSNIFQQHQHLQQPQIQHNQPIHQLQHNQQHIQQSQHHQQQLLQAHQQLQQQLQHQNQMKLQLEQQEKLRKEQEQRILLAQQQRQQEEARKKIKEQQAALKKNEEERIKKEAEERRIAEEEERKAREEEIRRKEAEELSKLEAEVEKRKEEAHADAEVIRERLESFSEPLHFAGIMPLTKIERFFPFPIDHEDFQQRPIIMDTKKMNERINRMADENTVERLSNLLNKCSKIMGKISFKETEFDENITLPNNLPPLIKQIKDSNSIAFDCPKGLSSEDLMITEYFMEENISGYNVGQMENLEQLLSSNNLPLLCDNEPSISMQKKQPSSSSLSDCPVTKKKKDEEMKVNNFQTSIDETKPSGSGQPKLLEFELRHFKIKRKKKESDSKGNTNDRPQTPPEILKQRQKDWSEWRKHQQEKVSRKVDYTHEWNNDVMAEKESFQKFCNIVDHILENVGEMTINQDDGEQEFVLIERSELDELRIEVQKLRHWKQLHKVSSERLVKLMTILEKNIRDVLKGDCGLLKPIENFNSQDSFFKELVHERILRALDACCIALNILNSPKMPKQVYIEDTIEGAVMLVKQLLINYVYPAYDVTMAKGSNTIAPGSQTIKKKNQDTPIKKKREKDVVTQNIRVFFARAVELYDCFADLVRIHTINETIAVKILYLGTGAMFVNNVEELQTSAINILSNICSKYTTMRFTILQELLNTLHRLPTGRNAKNCFRLNATETVSNFTILVLQLVQSIIKVPLRKKMTNDDEGESFNDKIMYDDSIVEQSYEKAKKLATFFLNGFLSKLSQKGDDDYKKHFDNFLQDILVTLFKPEWPASELVLLVLCKHLIHFYRTKSTDMSLRIASLDYLGTITARLRKDTLSSLDINSVTTKKQIDLIVKGIIFDEIDDVNKNLDDIDISNLSNNEKHRKLMQALVDYLLAKHGSGDVSVEYGILFYVGEWYKKYTEDYEKAKEEHQKQKNSSDSNERDLRKADKKFAKTTDKFTHMKHFLINLADKKHLKKRSQHIRKTSMIMLDGDAQWVVRYMASSREFSQSFDKYLKHILYGVHVETAIGLRTKAMRCLTQIIDADNEVLMIPEVNSAVQARMMDQNAAVREATIDLVGKYLNSHIEFLDSYFNVLMGRIKDSSLAVRKRVIRILRDIIEKRCDLPQNYKIFTEMVRRVNDEESVKKLVVETFQSFWFTITHDTNELSRRAYEMAKTMSNCNKEGLLPNVESLFTSLNKQMDRGFIESGEQIVDALIDIVLTLDQKITNAVNQAEDVHDEVMNTKSSHTLLTGVLLTLSVFSCVKPKLLLKHSEVLLPYLSMKAISPSEIQVLKEVIRMLEKIVPLMDYPSDTFINALEERLKELVLDGGKVIIAQALSCMSAAYKKWKKRKPLILTNFLIYLLYLLQLRKKELKKSIEMKEGKDDKDKKDDSDRSFTLRAIYTIGIMAKCYDFDEIMADEDKSITLTKPLILLLSEKRDLKDPRLFKETVHDILITFLKHPTAEIRLTALTSMGYFASEHSEYLTHQETKKMYLFLLTTNDLAYLKLKTQALQNLSLFLQAEDQKMAKSVERWQENKECEDLKEMELGCSGLSSSIIQNYWVSVLNSYFNLYEEVRLCASQVVWQTLQQGLVTPGSSIPTLIAMTTDPQIKIRYRIENVLKEIDSKYTGMIPSKSVLGIRMASKLHIMLKKVYKNSILRGIRSCDQVGQITLNEYNIPKNTDDAAAKLSGLYTLLQASKEKLSLEEWIFVADNLALFPYQVLDEPLYVINTADNIISLHGNDILANIKQMLLPKETIHEVSHMDEDVEFTAEFIYRRLPEDKSQIFELMNNRQACVLLNALKLFLMKMYGLNELKVKEYSPSEQAKVYEKPVTRKNISIFNPVSCLREFHPDVIAKRNTIAGHIELSHEIVSFRTMLLTVDKLDDDESVIKSSPSDYAQSAPNDSESQDDYDD
ncbi:Nipped-B-like protein [Strongyloides ratti]|uniref:Nipped-B protein n=1 Tax=Strongyloides ratti TaxID=34506 RepID=A0A090LLX1_STRRB|nr:Nipped-B-like protein [Strongyloides ratti]CEF70691.1 Nipped-B-like protein [Strongyloides ratti]